MSDVAATRMLFASPSEELIDVLYQALPREQYNILAINALDQPAEEVIAYARASSSEVLLARGGMVNMYVETQANVPDAIPVVAVPVTSFDIIDTIREAQQISKKIAFIAYAEFLEQFRKVTDFFDLDVRFVYRVSPWDCLEGVFTALEHKAEVIVGDARVIAVCRENNIPAVPVRTGVESMRQAYQTAVSIIRARDASRREANRMASLLDTVPQALFAFNADGKIAYGNAAAARLAGMSRGELYRHSRRELAFFKNNESIWPVAQETGSDLFIHPASRRAYTAHWQRLDSAAPEKLDVIAFEPAQENKLQRDPEHGHAPHFTFDDIRGNSPKLREAAAWARKFAMSDAPVLLFGQTGVGKELFAHAIHNAGARRDEPFVAVNLAALPATLIESELFGYVRGAFTDARSKGKQGVFEYAGSGTVFLDEIGEIPLETQSRLLRVLQDGEFMRLGDDRLLTARCRVIAATNRSLEHAVREGKFREDLYYRLNILRLNIPSLNERKSDIPLLTRFFLESLCARYAKQAGSVSPDALKMLAARSWRGNVRELKAILERYVVLNESDTVNLEAGVLHAFLNDEPVDASGGPEPADDRAILLCMERHGYRIGSAAAELGMHRTTLWRRLKKLGKLHP